MTVRRALLTARSACAAWGMAEIWRRAVATEGLEVRVLAQEPASTILRGEGVPLVAIDLPPLTDLADPRTERLLDRARAEQTTFGAEVALVGLSAPGEVGIDEAIVASAGYPTFLLQDFWGDHNLFFGRHADVTLASDETGAIATRERHGVPTIVLGSPRHAKYAGLDLETARDRMLESLGLSPELGLYAFFCQPLARIPGYLRTVELWSDAVASITGGGPVIYRPHPASDDRQIARLAEIMRASGLDPRIIRGGPIEVAIAASGVITSALSNSNIDAAYVNRFAATPKAAAVYMLCEPDVVSYMNEYQHVDSIPSVLAGLASVIRQRDEAAEVLASAMAPDSRRRVWERSRTLPDPVEAVGRAVDILLRPDAALAAAW